MYAQGLRPGGKDLGRGILDLFAEDAQVYFPNGVLPTAKEEIGQMFGDIGSTIKSIKHHFSHFNFIFSGSDLVVCEGTSQGEHRDGPARRCAEARRGAGATCSRFATGRFERCFTDLDPDYAGKDTARYPWFKNK